MGSPGGAREKISIDPKCVQAAHVEIMTVSTGIGLVQNVIVHMLERIRSMDEQQQQQQEKMVQGGHNYQHHLQQQHSERGINAIFEYLLTTMHHFHL